MRALSASRLREDDAPEAVNRALLKSPMLEIHERILFTTAFIASSLVTGLGAIFTEGDTRWLFITVSVSILTATSMALMVKRDDETIRVICGRCLLAIIGGVLGTNPAVHYFKIESADTNAISLACASAVTCIVTFFVGYALIKVLRDQSDNIAQGSLGWIYRRIFGKTYKKPKKETHEYL